MNRSRESRRDFLKTGTGLLAGSMAAPYIFTAAGAVAEEPKNDKLTMACIGVGGRGSDIGSVAAKLANVVACADVNTANAQKFIDRIGGKGDIYQDYHKVLDRKDIEAVTIGTPDHWHVHIALDALAAGKDVYCEKPLTLTIDESRIICKAVKESGRVFQVGTQQRSEYGSGFLEAVAIARAGLLGDKLTARASVGQATSGGPFPTEAAPATLDWDFWLGQAPVVDFCAKRVGWNFRWWFDYSGGQVTDWGVHHTDIALWALGGENTSAREVEGKGEFPVGRELVRDYLLGKKTIADLPNSYNVAKSFNVDLSLPNGNSINLNSVGNDLFISGDKGHLAVNRGGIRGKFIEDLKKSEKDKAWLEEEVAKLYKGKRRLGHIQNFIDCVKDRSLPVSDVYTHCNSVNACHMANIALLLERKITWDQEKQEFVNDAEANQLTRRHQREKYAFGA